MILNILLNVFIFFMGFSIGALLIVCITECQKKKNNRDQKK